MVCPQKLADFCQTGVVVSAGMAQLGPELFGIHSHCPEFIDVERPAETTDAFLFENGRASVFPFDGNVAE